MKIFLISFVCVLPLMLSCQKNEMPMESLPVTVESLVNAREFTDLGKVSLALTMDLIDKSNATPLFKSKIDSAIKQNDSNAIITALGYEDATEFLTAQKLVVDKLEKVYLAFPELRNRPDKDQLLEDALARYTENSMRNAKIADKRSNCMYGAAAKFGAKLFIGMVAMSAPTGLSQVAGAIGIGIAAGELSGAMEACNAL